MGGQVGGGGQRAEIGTERDFTWGHGCIMQYADEVSSSCTLETCRFCDQCHPNKFNYKYVNKFWHHYLKKKKKRITHGATTNHWLYKIFEALNNRKRGVFSWEVNYFIILSL